jgi:Snf7
MLSRTRPVRLTHSLDDRFVAAADFYLFFIYSFSQVATAALRRKKMHEGDLDKLAGTRLQLETQVNTLESANINANTLEVMRKGANALKDIHNGMCVPLFLTSGEQILFSSLSFLRFTSCNLFFFFWVCVFPVVGQSTRSTRQ